MDRGLISGSEKLTERRFLFLIILLFFETIAKKVSPLECYYDKYPNVFH